MPNAIAVMGQIIAEQERRYKNLVAWLYSASTVDDDDVVRIDTNAMSNILENLFKGEGLIEPRKEK